MLQNHKMIRRALFVCALLGSSNLFADSCVPNQPQSTGAYEGVQWYRDSAERNAIYREVFLLGTMMVQQQVAQKKLQPHQWGVVFDIDETVLDNSAMLYQRVLDCASLQLVSNDYSRFQIQERSLPTPGVKQASCSIQKMGGYVTLISNRDGTYTDPKTQQNLLVATLENLNKAGICYDQVVLSHGFNFDKNARFQAVLHGAYDPQAMVYNKTLPAHAVIAYFGDNIQDFPQLYQKEMIKQDPNGAAYNAFGLTFFALPNPMYGSWQSNSFK